MGRLAGLLKFVFLFIPWGLYSQTFISTIGTSLDDIPDSPYELPTGDYLLHISRGEYYPNQMHSYYSDIIFKLDSFGNCIDSVLLDESRFYYIASLNLFQYQQNTFFWSTITDKTNPGHPGLMYGFLSNDLDVFQPTVIFDADTGWAFYSCIVNHQGNLVFIGTEGVLSDREGHNIVWELNPVDGIIKRGGIDRNYYTKIVELPAIQGYHLGGFDTICQMNYNLEYEGIVFARPMDDTLIFYTDTQSLTDSTYARCAVGFEFPAIIEDFGVGIFNQLGQRIAGGTFGKPDTSDWSYRLDCHSPDTIFLAGRSNYPDYEFEQTDSWFGVYNINRFCDLNWSFYFGKSGLYVLSDVLATSDGGCLITGTCWDWRNNPNQERDAIIVKVNDQGLIVNTDENDEPVVFSFLVYPNPGSQKLYLECGLSDGMFEMYDHCGRNVVSKHFSTGYLVLNTSKLANGLYYYRIISCKKAYYSGKWIKE